MKCRFCKGPLMLLGQLGPMKHYRCRDCGAQFTKDAKKAAVNPEARRAALIEQLTTPRTAGEVMPGTLYEEAFQLKQKAMNLRTTFGIDEQFKQINPQIMQAAKLLEQAADILYVDNPGPGNANLRMVPHKFHQGQQ